MRSPQVKELATLDNDARNYAQRCGVSLVQSGIGTAAVDYLMYSGYLVLADLWPKAGKPALQQLAPRAGIASVVRTLGPVLALESGATDLTFLPENYFYGSQ